MEATLATPLLGARAASAGGARATTRRGFIVLALAVAALLLLALGARREPLEGDDGPALLLSGGLARDSCQDDAKNEAGYVRLADKSDTWYFYWYFEARQAPEAAPLVLWLSGGPGCSSLYTLLTENGPCSVQEDLTTRRNPFSWNSQANVVWLDQPTDVGYSRGEVGEYDHSEDQVQSNIYAFLTGFMSKHPELRRRPLFIAGESYAGHYVPAAAHYIWLQSKNTSADALQLDLQGIAIGNGLVNPAAQSKHGLDMVNNSYNVTLMDPATLEGAKKALPQCTALIDSCQSNTTACLDAALFCESNVEAAFSKSHRNSFDIRKPCDEADPMNCYNASAVTRYLNSPLVRAYLNVTEGKQAKVWESCSSAVAMGFAFDVMKRFDHYAADLLDSGHVRVLVYHGDADLVCNWYGGLAWLQELGWKHRDVFNHAKDRPFLVDTGGHYHSASQAGVVRSVKNQLTFVRAFNAGHFMPMDQPAVALAMITKFLKGEEL